MSSGEEILRGICFFDGVNVSHFLDRAKRMIEKIVRGYRVYGGLELSEFEFDVSSVIHVLRDALDNGCIADKIVEKYVTDIIGLLTGAIRDARLGKYRDAMFKVDEASLKLLKAEAEFSAKRRIKELSKAELEYKHVMRLLGEAEKMV